MFDEMIENHAKIESLDPNWVKAIIQQESRFNLYSIRYEPTYPYLFRPEFYSKILNITLDTEMMCQKMSWGLGQIMGGLARNLGFSKDLPALIDSETNIIYICEYLNQLKSHAKMPEQFFAGYNGGVGAILSENNGVFSNQKYVNSCMSHLKDLESK
jgi:soluble lytic murein transglycosylase-like protein